MYGTPRVPQKLLLYYYFYHITHVVGASEIHNYYIIKKFKQTKKTRHFVGTCSYDVSTFCRDSFAVRNHRPARTRASTSRRLSATSVPASPSAVFLLFFIRCISTAPSANANPCYDQKSYNKIVKYRTRENTPQERVGDGFFFIKKISTQSLFGLLYAVNLFN